MSRGDVYKKVDGVWVKQDNIKGPGADDPGYIPVFDSTSQLIHDASTLALFTCQDAAHPWQNHISGTDDLTVYKGDVRALSGVGSISTGTLGPFGTPPCGFGLLPYLAPSSDHPCLKSANGAWEPSGALTVAMWLMRCSGTVAGHVQDVIHKAYRPAAWDAPLTVVRFLLTDVDQINITLKTVSTDALCNLDASVVLPLWEWSLISFTYSTTSQKLKVYCNGQKVVEDDASGEVAWQTGGNASPWVFGRPVASSSDYCPDMYFGPVWIESAERSAAYELARYKAGARRY